MRKVSLPPTKKRYTCFPFSLLSIAAIAWGPNTLMGISGAAGAHGLEQAPNGQLIAALSHTTTSDGVLISFLVSDDQGETCSDATCSIAGMGMCTRVKLLRTSSAGIWA